MKALVPPSIEIGKNITLAEVESRLAEIEARSDRDDATLHLARHLGPNFFVESWVTALIATLSSRHPLTVRDWHRNWEAPEVDQFFKARLSGFSALMNARGVENDSAQTLPVTPAQVRAQTSSLGGVLERNVSVLPPEGVDDYLPGIEMTRHAEGRSITICAVDSDTQRNVPVIFSGLMGNRKSFISSFLNLKHRYMERGTTSGLEHLDQLAAEEALATFVFEAFQNSFEHGCRDQHGKVIPGVRSILLRKHASIDPSGFLARAQGFPALEEFLKQEIIPGGHTKLLEVSVSDQGLGILGNYLHSQGRFAERTILSGEERRDLLQDLISGPLTSKTTFPGAGQGLPNVTKAVQTLGGFLTVRTDESWLTYGKQGQRYVFQSIDAAPVVGTHISLLFPLRSR